MVATIPAEPVAGQDFIVFVQTNFGQCPVVPGGRANVAGGEIVVSFDTSRCGSVSIGLPPADSPRGALVNVAAPGNYAVMHAGSRIGTLAVKAGPATPVVRSAPLLNGLWNVPSAPGWGIRITEGATGQLFVVWYASGNAPGRWFVSSGGSWTGPNEYSAVFYDPSGPTLSAFNTFDWSRAFLEPVGVLTINVADADRITMKVAGRLGFAGFEYGWALQRLRF